MGEKFINIGENMILVMLGTQNNSFYRLLEEIEYQIKKGTIKEEVIVQSRIYKI